MIPIAGKKPFKNFSQAYNYLTHWTNYEQKTNFAYTRDIFDLNQVRRLLRKLGNPDRDMHVIHIAGTKGKGSVAFMISSVLSEVGYRVGKFISPHLVRINERISINQEEITDGEFTQMMNVLFPQVEKAREKANPLTFFDIITILALTFFSHKGADFAVLETGLGGRLDSTNVVSPAVCVITSIGFDHMDKLGNTLEKITFEKAGIIKEKVPVISGVTNAEAAKTIGKVAFSKNAPLFQIGKQFKFSARKSSFKIETWRESYSKLTLPLLGEHQRNNAAVAIATLDSLFERDIAYFSQDQVKVALAKLGIPGRIEIISHNPTIVLDVAHNPSSLLALSNVLKAQFPKKRKVFLFAMLRDKDIRGSLKIILPLASEIVFTSADSPRSEKPKKLAKVARELGFKDILIEPDIKSAYKLALEITSEDDLFCITGSTYLVGKVVSLSCK